MAIYKVQTNIQGVFTEMDLFLAGKRVQLAYDGDQTYASTDQFDLATSLVLQWIGRGLSFQQWIITLSISPQQKDGSFGEAKKWTKNGQIPENGGSQVYQEIPIPLP